MPSNLIAAFQQFASLLRAVPLHSQVLYIGDGDQLPSVRSAMSLKRGLIEPGRLLLPDQNFPTGRAINETKLTIPDKFQHVDLGAVVQANTPIDELVNEMKKVHPWSSQHYGLTASQIVKNQDTSLRQTALQQLPARG